jgi:hypothetical protein
MAFICATLPDGIRNTLEANLLTAFGKSNLLTDRKTFEEDEIAASETVGQFSEKEKDVIFNEQLDGASVMEMKGDVLPFHCAHFTWYNRYTTPVGRHHLRDMNVS